MNNLLGKNMKVMKLSSTMLLTKSFENISIRFPIILEVDRWSWEGDRWSWEGV